MSQIPSMVWMALRYSRRRYATPRRRARVPVFQEPRRAPPGRTFELECMDALMATGWQVRHIGGPGDQGADLIAAIGNTTLALQCKAYTIPVSNRSVQEAFSAAAHHGCKYGVVVAPNGFTEAAKALAGTTRVILLHPEDLATLHRHFSKPYEPSVGEDPRNRSLIGDLRAAWRNRRNPTLPPDR